MGERWLATILAAVSLVVTTDGGANADDPRHMKARYAAPGILVDGEPQSKYVVCSGFAGDALGLPIPDLGGACFQHDLLASYLVRGGTLTIVAHDDLGEAVPFYWRLDRRHSPGPSGEGCNRVHDIAVPAGTTGIFVNVMQQVGRGGPCPEETAPTTGRVRITIT